MFIRRYCLAIILPLIFIVLGCSGTGSQTTIPEYDDGRNPGNVTQRILWGIWEIRFDASKKSISINPVREIGAHFNITNMVLPPYCDDCLEISVQSFDPLTRILQADVLLRNSFPATGYDVRGILFTDDYGHELRNADGWTNLWDVPGAENINPFKAFAKGSVNRVFESHAEHIETYAVYIPIPPHYAAITFAVDVSWPGNCKEPYGIFNFFQESIHTTSGSSGNVSVDVLDWQDDVSEVTIEAPQITGEDSSEMVHTGEIPGS